MLFILRLNFLNSFLFYRYPNTKNFIWNKAAASLQNDHYIQNALDPVTIFLIFWG